MHYPYSNQEYITRLQSIKSQINDRRPFSNSLLKNLQQRFQIAYIHHTNAIEWNTLTMSEVKVLLEDGITIWGKSVREHNETLNHYELIQSLWSLFQPWKEFSITQEFILSTHSILMQKNLPLQELWMRRAINISVSGSEDVFPTYHEVPWLMSTYFDTTVASDSSLEKISAIHCEFVKIHPFTDGNWRIARLLMNLALINAGYFPIIFPVSVRAEYISSLQWEQWCEKFLSFFLRQCYENHKDYARHLEIPLLWQ
jgi:Fic family protein